MTVVFVNDRRLTVGPGATARDAVAVADPAWEQALGSGRAYLTDGRGLRLEPGGPVAAGAIIRVVLSAREGGGGPRADP
jgi:hypothetical protein